MLMPWRHDSHVLNRWYCAGGLLTWAELLMCTHLNPLRWVQTSKVTSHEHHGGWNHRQLDSLFNSLFSPENMKVPCHWPFVRGIHEWPVNSRQKRPFHARKPSWKTLTHWQRTGVTSLVINPPTSNTKTFTIRLTLTPAQIEDTK